MNAYLYGMTNYYPPKGIPWQHGPPMYALILSGPWTNWLLCNGRFNSYCRVFYVSGPSRAYTPPYWFDLPRPAGPFPFGFHVEPDVPP